MVENVNNELFSCEMCMISTEKKKPIIHLVETCSWWETNMQ